jgi:hypothetical protein
MKASSMRQLGPTTRLRLRNTAASTGTILIIKRCTLEWSKLTPFLHHFFHMSQFQWIVNVPTNTDHHDFHRTVKPLKEIVQSAVENFT